MNRYFEIQQNGNTFMVLRPTLNLSTAVYFLPERSPELSLIAYRDIVTTFGNIMNKGNMLAGRFSESAFNDENKELLSIMANGIKKFRLDALALKEKTNAMRKDFLVYSNDQNNSEIRTLLKEIEPLKIFEIAMKDSVVCSAVLEFPNLMGLTPDLLKQLEDTQIERKMIERFKSQSPAKPSLDNIFPDGGDFENAQKMAENNIAKLNSNNDEVKLAESTIRQMIAFYGVVMGTDNLQVVFDAVFKK